MLILSRNEKEKLISNLVITCIAEALHDMNPDVDLRRKDCDTPSPKLRKWITQIEWVDYKALMGAKSYIGSLLGEIRLYKWNYHT
jgi:hypothetical protein